MTILRWDVPKKIRTTEQWAEHAGFDGGPTGGYVPNMSEADQLSWKAKITGKKLGYPQVEIRKTTKEGSQVVIIVNLGDGYNYKQYRAEQEERRRQYDINRGIVTEEDFVRVNSRWYSEEVARSVYQRNKYPTRGINVHIATNGPIQMTFQEMQDMQTAIEEAKQVLTELEGVKQ